MPNLKKAGYQGTTLTTEQKSAAAAAFESCINNSDFVLPSQLYDPSGRDGSYTRKYSNQNDPLRLYICFAKGALQNVYIIYYTYYKDVLKFQSFLGMH